MPCDKSMWIQRFNARLMTLQPSTLTGLLPQISETIWYYQRYREPEDAALARANGQLSLPGRRDAWVAACSAAIHGLDPHLGLDDTHALAATLWDEDWSRTVDPYLMAEALWEQAILLASQATAEQDRQPSLYTVFRTPGP